MTTARDTGGKKGCDPMPEPKPHQNALFIQKFVNEARKRAKYHLVRIAMAQHVTVHHVQIRNIHSLQVKSTAQTHGLTRARTPQ